MPIHFREVYVAYRIHPPDAEPVFDNLALGGRTHIQYHPDMDRYWPAIEFLFPLADPGGHAGVTLFGKIIRDEGAEVDIEYQLTNYPEGERPILRMRPLTLAFWNSMAAKGEPGFLQTFDNLARLKAHLWDEALDGTDWWKEFPPLPSGYKPEKEAEKEPGEEKSKS